MRITNRPLSLSSIVTTRNPDRPRIHVQSRRDPTGPPLLVAHQERTPSNPGWPTWDRVSASRPLSHSDTIYSARVWMVNTGAAGHAQAGKLRGTSARLTHLCAT